MKKRKREKKKTTATADIVRQSGRGGAGPQSPAQQQPRQMLSIESDAARVTEGVPAQQQLQMSPTEGDAAQVTEGVLAHQHWQRGKCRPSGATQRGSPKEFQRSSSAANVAHRGRCSAGHRRRPQLTGGFNKCSGAARAQTLGACMCSMLSASCSKKIVYEFTIWFLRGHRALSLRAALTNAVVPPGLGSTELYPRSVR